MSLEKPPLDAQLLDVNGKLKSPWFEYFEEFARYINNNITSLNSTSLASTVNDATDTAIAADDRLSFTDVSDSNSLKRDTVQGILDLVTTTDPGSELIHVETISSGATVDLDEIFTTDYDEYDVYFDNIFPATSGATPHLRVGTGTGAVTYQTANYKWVGTLFVTSTAGNYSTSDSEIEIYDCTPGTGTGQSLNGRFTVFKPADASYYTHIVGSLSTLRPSGFMGKTEFAGCYAQSAAVTSLQLKFSSGNVASGVIRVYARRKTI